MMFKAMEVKATYSSLCLFDPLYDELKKLPKDKAGRAGMILSDVGKDGVWKAILIPSNTDEYKALNDIFAKMKDKLEIIGGE